MAAELVEEFRLDLVLEAGPAGKCHGAQVRLDGDGGRTAHARDLSAALVEPQVVQQVIERDELVGRVGARAAAVAQRGNPADQAGIELRVRAHRVEDPLGLLDDAGQDFVDIGDRKGIVGAKLRNCLAPGPRGRRPRSRVAGRDRGRTGCTRPRGRPGRQDGDRLGLGEAGDVVEVAVLPIGILDVAAAQLCGRGGQDADAAPANHAHQLPPAPGELRRIHGAINDAGSGEALPDVVKLVEYQLHADPHELHELGVGSLGLEVGFVLARRDPGDFREITP